MTQDNGLVYSTQCAAEAELWHLCLYVAGASPRSLHALKNLRALCDAHLSGRYRIEVVDVVQFPERAQHDQIVALPTVVRKMPPPAKKVIGDLSNCERTLDGLQIDRLPALTSAP